MKQIRLIIETKTWRGNVKLKERTASAHHGCRMSQKTKNANKHTHNETLFLVTVIHNIYFCSFNFDLCHKNKALISNKQIKPQEFSKKYHQSKWINILPHLQHRPNLHLISKKSVAEHLQHPQSICHALFCAFPFMGYLHKPVQKVACTYLLSIRSKQIEGET